MVFLTVRFEAVLLSTVCVTRRVFCSAPAAGDRGRGAAGRHGPAAAAARRPGAGRGALPAAAAAAPAAAGRAAPPRQRHGRPAAARQAHGGQWGGSVPGWD